MNKPLCKIEQVKLLGQMFVILLVFLGYTSTSQELAIKNNVVISVSRNAEVLGLKVLENGNGVLFSKQNARFFIHFFNENLNEVTELNISEQLGEKNLTDPTLFKFDKKLFLVAKEINKKEKKVKVNIFEILTSDKRLSNDMMEIGSFPYYQSQGKVEFVICEDNSDYFAIIYRDKIKTSQVQNLFFNIIDENFEMHGETIKLLNHKGELFDNYKVIFPNDGYLYFYGTLFDNMKVKNFKGGKKHASYKGMIYRYNIVKRVWEEKGFNIENKFLSDFRLIDGKDGKLYASGYYSNFKKDHTSGIFTYSFDSSTMEGIHSGTSEFTVEACENEGVYDLKSSLFKGARRDKEGLSHYLTRDLIKTDGYLYLIGEKYKFINSDNGSAGKNGKFHVYGDVLNTKTPLATFKLEEMNFHTKYQKIYHFNKPIGSFYIREKDGDMVYRYLADNKLNEYDLSKNELNSVKIIEKQSVREGFFRFIECDNEEVYVVLISRSNNISNFKLVCLKEEGS